MRKLSQCTVIIKPYTRKSRTGRVVKVKPHARKQWHVSYKTPTKIVHDVKEYPSKASAQKIGKAQLKEISERYGDPEMLVSPVMVMNQRFEQPRKNGRS